MAFIFTGKSNPAVNLGSGKMHAELLLFGLSPAPKRICPFQLSLHFIDRNLRRIIIDRVDLFEIMPAALNLFDTVQPIQGCFADIISVHVKGCFGQWGFIGMGFHITKTEQNQQHGSKQNRVN